MKVYKFGGASVKSAAGVNNLLRIVQTEEEPLVVVVSAMGKTTNALEAVAGSFFNGKSDVQENLQIVMDYHERIVANLFDDRSEVDSRLSELYDRLQEILSQKPSMSYDYEYDRIVSFGELLSTTIISAYLNAAGCANRFVDIRTCLKTDDNYREGNVDMELSGRMARKVFDPAFATVYITQGFIAGTVTNQTTTLGREGSDYTAAILANLLNAASVTIWKDVPGVMNADPKRYSDVVIIPKLSYREAIELSYCGASVIHPKTVKPLQNKQIPLHVKSFTEPQRAGSVIHELPVRPDLPPIYIGKANQVLLTLRPRDFSFIAEEKLSEIFALLASYRLKISLVQMSAISFTLCVDHNPAVFERLLADLKAEYEVLYNTDVELITIRHYSPSDIEKVIGKREVFVEQRNRSAVRFVIKMAEK